MRILEQIRNGVGRRAGAHHGERLDDLIRLLLHSGISDGEQTFVNVERGGRFDRQNVTVGAVNTHEAVVTGGLAEGVVVARNVGGPTK